MQANSVGSENSDLSRLAAQLEKTATDAVMFRRRLPQINSDCQSCGAFGGLPHLPESFGWPRSLLTGLPMHFLAEIDLGALPTFGQRDLLPVTGSLIIFVDLSRLDAVSSGRVIYSTSPIDLLRIERAPDDLPTLCDYASLMNIPWIRTAPSARIPRCFPRFVIEPVLMRTYQCAPNSGKHGEGAAYADLWRTRQKAAAEAAFGKPTEATYAMTDPSRVMALLNAHLGRSDLNDGEVCPDDEWPYAWLFVDLVVGLIGDRPGARDWLDEASKNNAFARLPRGQHQQFRSWCEGQVCHQPNFRWELNRTIGTSIQHGHVWLMTAGPDSYRLLPKHVIDVMQGYHAPLEWSSEADGNHFQLTRHQMLGHPPAIQDETILRAEQQILLLQLDSDYGMEWIWGDVGHLQFWVLPEDLAAKNFDNVEVTLSGG